VKKDDRGFIDRFRWGRRVFLNGQRFEAVDTVGIDRCLTPIRVLQRNVVLRQLNERPFVDPPALELDAELIAQLHLALDQLHIHGRPLSRLRPEHSGVE
jgi:hypothetical protein